MEQRLLRMAPGLSLGGLYTLNKQNVNDNMVYTMYVRP